MPTKPTRFNRSTLLLILGASLLATACVSGPLKINQSGKPAQVVDTRPPQDVRKVSYQVLIIPSGAIKTSYISDKTSTVGGFIGSMVVGPVAGVIGGLAGSTAGSAAASNAEEAASKNVDSQDVAKAIGPANLPVYFSQRLTEQLKGCGIDATLYPETLEPTQINWSELKGCGIDATLYPETLEPTQINWSETHLNLPAIISQDAAPYRFFLQAGVTQINLRSGVKDDTLEGAAYVRVYETRSLKQIGRYSYKTGTTGSVTLDHYSKTSPQQAAELAQASKAVAQYLVSGIATDMCAVMKRF